MITIEIKGSKENLLEDDVVDKNKSEASSQETTFMLLETKGKINFISTNS